MKLHRLRLANFRQHRDTEIELWPGLTGIIGPNGAGKSTLLEALAWAIYGAAAARGTNESLRFARAEPRSPVRVELEFGLGGQDYRVIRTLTGADVFADGQDDPVATTIRGATEFLQQRIGLSREEFFNTYFTGQKELHFLAQMGPAERGRFLAQVLGYERLRVAQERVRARRSELGHEIDGLLAGMADPGALRAERDAAVERCSGARAEWEAARAELEAARAVLADLAPRWVRAQEAQAQVARLEHQRELEAQQYRDASRLVVRAEEEFEAVERGEAELAPLRRDLAELPAQVREHERLSELARVHERRRVLEETAGQLRQEVSRTAVRLERLTGAEDFVARFRAELEEMREQLVAAEAAVERERDLWLQDRQEIRTRLLTYTDRTAELQQQLDQLREAGPEGECPTCARPLQDHFEQVMKGLEDEWESLVQDGKWLKKREKQLEPKPVALAEAEAARAEVQSRIERRTEKLRRAELAVAERVELEAELTRARDRLATMDEELAALPAGHDPGALDAAQRRLERLRELERRATRLEEIASRRPRVKQERDEAVARRDAAETRGRAARAEMEALGFPADAFEGLRRDHEEATNHVRGLELRATEARGRLDAAEERVQAMDRSIEEYDAKRQGVDRLEIERKHHAELDRAFTRLRTDLNARVRPELSELASAFLADITGGRYSALEIDDNYNVLLFDHGEEKPVISGGEEDVANLVLRLAISQMIAERAGHPLSILILDEVFASLDVDRRDAVIQLLRGLTGRFEQVILISHIEAMRDGLDHVIHCTFDERTGASRVVAPAVPAFMARPGGSTRDAVVAERAASA
jgi:DNA repair protein SbcC/Rad50